MANLDIPCRKHCNRKEHGDFIVSALTKRSVTDAELAAFLNYTCVLCGSSKDTYKRTALHMAASCGRTHVCKWLVRQKRAKIDEKDAESGYTALHRSIFCGKIDTAVALIQLGSNLHTLDANHLTPLDHAALDNLRTCAELRSPLVYVWGTNTNYTLGPNQARRHPEALDAFHKRHPQAEAREIHLEKFHTVIVARGGEAYTFGHGQGGRLGLGTEMSVLEPTEVKLAAKIKSCAIARDHCLFLTETGEVWSCGLNTHRTLGITPPPSQSLVPRHVSALKTPSAGVACGLQHSAAWTTNALYTWGRNVGQLGHADVGEPTQTRPKLVACLSPRRRRIVSVAASACATVVATDAGDVYVLHQHRCRAIASKRAGISAVRVHDDGGGGDDELRVLALTAHGDLLLWHATDPQLHRCAYSLKRALNVRDARLHAEGLVLVTQDREVFNGQFTTTSTTSTTPLVRLTRVARLYGADSVTCDLEGRNFAALHLNSAKLQTRAPAISPSTMRDDFARLLTDPVIDPDVTFKVGGRLFPAHRFVVRASSRQLDDVDDDFLALADVDPAIFSALIAYFYTGCLNASIDDEILSAAERLGVKSLCNNKAHQWSRSDAPHLHDARLRATAGDGGHVDVHRCVLAARSDFFANAFSARWTTQRKMVELPGTLASVRQLVDYLYADDVAMTDVDVEGALALLALADHVRMVRLVEICELALSERITTKNVLRLLAVADAYGAAQLKTACMEHACLNLALHLETRRLEQLDDALLADLTSFYAHWNAKMLARIVPPFGDAVDDAIIVDAIQCSSVRVDERRGVHRRRGRVRRARPSSSSSPPPPSSPLQEEQANSGSRRHDAENYGAHNALREFPALSDASASPKTPRSRHTPGKTTRLSQRERKRLDAERTMPSQQVASETPTNAWHVDVEAAHNDALVDILCEEMQQRKELGRVRRKLLIHTQMEDQALEDLRRFYNADGVFDEIIQVVRVDCGRMATPLWIRK